MAIPASIDLVLTANAQVMVSTVLYSQATLIKVTAVNTDAVSHYVSVYRVPPNQQPGQQYLIVSDQELDPTQTVVLPINGHAVHDGSSFYAISDEDGVVNLAVTYATTP